MWTRRRALTLIKTVEERLSAVGWHVALAGGVLTKGRSSHDLDLVIYPHSTVGADVNVTRVVFEGLGWELFRSYGQVQRYWRSIGSNDQKHVEVWWIGGDHTSRVDVIYPVAFESLALRGSK